MAAATKLPREKRKEADRLLAGHERNRVRLEKAECALREARNLLDATEALGTVLSLRRQVDAVERAMAGTREDDRDRLRRRVAMYAGLV